MIIIDRIEGEYAVLEVEGTFVDFPVAALPEGAVEGSVLRLSVEEDATRLREAQDRLDRLNQRDPNPGGGVIDL